MPTSSAWTSATGDPDEFDDLLFDYVTASVDGHNPPTDIPAEIADLLTSGTAQALARTVTATPDRLNFPVILDAEMADLGDDDYDDEGNLLSQAVVVGRRRYWIGTPAERRMMAARLRAQKAIELRAKGKGLAQIAEELHFNSLSGVRYAIEREMERLKEGAEQWRSLELLRIDRIVETLTPLAEMGDIEAIDKLLKAIQLQAKIAGIVGGSGKAGVSISIGGADLGANDPNAAAAGQTFVAQRITVVEHVNQFLGLIEQIQSQPKPFVIDQEGNDVS